MQFDKKWIHAPCVNHLPFLCIIKSLTSLDWDKFPNTRMASRMASMLELNTSFNITMWQGNEGAWEWGWAWRVGGVKVSRRHAHTHREVQRTRSLPGLTLCDGELAVPEHSALRLVEGQVVEGGGHVHHQLLAVLHGPQLCVTTAEVGNTALCWKNYHQKLR